MTKFVQWWKTTFTFERWRNNPFQLYATTFLLLTSTAQVGLGISPQTVTAELDRTTQVTLAFCNIIGASIVLYGLHLKGTASSLWIELSGYVSLIFVLSVYIYMLTTTNELPATTYGFAFAEAFVYASIHRSVQILLFKRAERRKRTLERNVDTLREVLWEAGIDPDDLPGHHEGGAR